MSCSCDVMGCGHVIHIVPKVIQILSGKTGFFKYTLKYKSNITFGLQMNCKM